MAGFTVCLTPRTPAMNLDKSIGKLRRWHSGSQADPTSPHDASCGYVHRSLLASKIGSFKLEYMRVVTLRLSFSLVETSALEVVTLEKFNGVQAPVSCAMYRAPLSFIQETVVLTGY